MKWMYKSDQFCWISILPDLVCAKKIQFQEVIMICTLTCWSIININNVWSTVGYNCRFSCKYYISYAQQFLLSISTIYLDSVLVTLNEWPSLLLSIGADNWITSWSRNPGRGLEVQVSHTIGNINWHDMLQILPKLSYLSPLHDTLRATCVDSQLSVTTRLCSKLHLNSLPFLHVIECYLFRECKELLVGEIESKTTGLVFCIRKKWWLCRPIIHLLWYSGWGDLS